MAQLKAHNSLLHQLKMTPPHRRRAFVYAYHLLLTLPTMLADCFLLCAEARSQSQPVGKAELLLQMKRTWGDPSVLAAWSANSATGAHCRWPYVGCDSAGNVTNLALAGINVTGHVPDAVGGPL
jgi:hypothetical protein